MGYTQNLDLSYVHEAAASGRSCGKRLAWLQHRGAGRVGWTAWSQGAVTSDLSVPVRFGHFRQASSGSPSMRSRSSRGASLWSTKSWSIYPQSAKEGLMGRR